MWPGVMEHNAAALLVEEFRPRAVIHQVAFMKSQDGTARSERPNLAPKPWRIFLGPAFHMNGAFRLSLFWVSLECSEGCNLDGRRVESVTMSTFIMNFCCIWSLVLLDVALETIVITIY